MLADMLRHEGGYSNNPSDPGGETNYGITVGTARANGYQGAMRDMTRQDAIAIYKRQYYYGPNLNAVDAVSPGIAAELFDTGINMGTKVAATFLQRALNALNRNGADYPDLALDGSIGPSTIAALKAYLAKRGVDGEHVLLKALNCLQGERYISLTEKNHRLEDFTFGWLANRVDMSV